MLGQDERQESGLCVGKRISGEVFTRRGRCVATTDSVLLGHHTLAIVPYQQFAQKAKKL